VLDAARVAEEVRAALVQSAVAAYEDASMRGLCSEGAWEVAMAAMRRQTHPDLARAEASLRIEVAAVH
jgi:hypothetical protein